ncbi:phosphatidylinositol-specific phospholipase C1-like protein [Luteimonas panaciterrae]|uniref:phosphatidylinositol-specific phospholipase C1-like protein n=1 Tax=Luteimonas panaciterrae TaxID=363885 RepID=UPI001CFC0903|nr:phosphatidylinositol-specific phospholipase C1-like protein [Luteimonas panaciterrae]
MVVRIAGWLLTLTPWAAIACDLEAARPPRSGPCAASVLDNRLRMNDVQVIGTHNSYKLPLPADELAAHRKVDRVGAESIDYGHRPLAEQLDAGLRSFELDVYYDPEGGRYLHPPGAHRRGYPKPPWPAAQLEQMRRPGFKTMHLSDIDFRSSCVTFRVCLTIVRDWSRAHPRHVPILILINAKDSKAGAGAVQPLPFDAKAFDALDAEIREVLPQRQLIVPDQVQGDFQTLREAVLANRWPTLAQARGKIFFALDEEARKVALYRGDRRSLEGRVMFVNTDESSPAAAYLTLNDPLAQRERIARAVADGFIVRTRADADTVEARRHDTRRRKAAFASGAQTVSTDYPQPDPRRGRYRVVFPGQGFVRCNPSRDACRSSATERAP